MPKCAHCGVTILAAPDQVVRDAGDWIISCAHCVTKNKLALTASGPLDVSNPRFAIIGWRD